MPPKRGWDAESDLALFHAFLDEIKPTKAIVANVTERLQQQGFTYSFDAVNQHIQKLRKNRDVSGIQNASGGAAANGSVKKPAAPRKRAPASKKGAKSKLADDSSDAKLEDDEEDIAAILKKEDNDLDLNSDCEESPSKRAKFSDE